MPGYELINNLEKTEVNKVFLKKHGNGVLFRQGFENLRNNTFKVKDFEKSFSKFFKVKYSLAVTSGTAALRVALAALDIKKGDEIIIPSFTFVATAEAIIESGANPICCEIDQTLNISPLDLKKKINKKTKAVIVVHMLGVPAKILEIKKICKGKKIFLIEDTAWGCGGKVKNKYLGTFGEIGTFSFDYAKMITTGEGGMCVFKNKNHYLKARAWHDHGHENNPKVPRWEDTRSSSGFNYRMNELQGALGLIQLRKLKKLVKTHNINYNKIKNIVLKYINTKEREIIPNSIITADAFVFFVNSEKVAINLKKRLFKEKIFTKILPEAISWHFAGQWEHMKFKKPNLSMSKKILKKSISLPIFYYMNSNYFRKLNKVLKIFFNQSKYERK